jgi:hypothetical protein
MDPEYIQERINAMKKKEIKRRQIDANKEEKNKAYAAMLQQCRIEYGIDGRTNLSPDAEHNAVHSCAKRKEREQLERNKNPTQGGARRKTRRNQKKRRTTRRR